MGAVGWVLVERAFETLALTVYPPLSRDEIEAIEAAELDQRRLCQRVFPSRR